MIVFLTSSPTGSLDGKKKVIGLDESNQFGENLRKHWVKDARCLIITASPDAYEANEQMTEFFENAVIESGLSISAFDLWDGRTTNTSKELLHTYDVVFLGGGHVPTQHQFFESIHLRESIQGFKGIVIGMSAGSMNCAETVYAQPEEAGETIDPEYIRFFPGLGLTKTMILPHYQMVKDYIIDGKRLYEDVTYEDSMGRRFLVLVDGSYVMIEHGTETVWGEAYWLADGKMKVVSI